MRSKEVDLPKDHAHTTSCSICSEIKITSCSRDALGHFLKEEEYGEFDRFSDWTFAVHLQYSKHIEASIDAPM